ncbi:MAG: hypothetical protein ABIA93_01785 [Candidatus Woesearchaeota archaeon]
MTNENESVTDSKKIITLDSLVKKDGTFEEQYSALEGTTWLTSKQFHELAWIRGSIRYRTGDGAVYSLNAAGECFLYITSANLNPILKPENVHDAVKQIMKSGNYTVKDSDLAEIVAAAEKNDGSVTAINLSRLSSLVHKYKTRGNESSFIEFKTGDAIKYTDLFRGEDLKLVGALFGKGDQFVKNMDQYKIWSPCANYGEDGHYTGGYVGGDTRIYFLGREYVAEKASKGAFARMTILDGTRVYDHGTDVSSRHLDWDDYRAYGIPNKG